MTSTAEAFVDRAADPQVRGYLHLPSSKANSALVFTHGAGGNANGPFLIALAEAFAEAGIVVLRCDLPFRQVRSFGPPRPGDAARDRAGLSNAVASMRQKFSGHVYLGGHSYGGRQASMLVAENSELVSGLLLSSYPLHPPSNPTRMRTEHLPNIRIRTLFVQGTRDSFGTIEQIEAARKLIPAKTALLQVEDAGHDLGFSRKIADAARTLPARATQAFLSLVA